MNAERYCEVFVAGNFWAYRDAQEALTQAFRAEDRGAGLGGVLRAGMNAAVAAHPFADAVLVLEDEDALTQHSKGTAAADHNLLA